MTAMPHDLEKDPLFLLYDVARLMRTRADQRARLMGMTRAQWVILAWLELEPGLSQNELASLVEVEPITVARLIDRLEARGYVERRADPKDRRIKRLHLLTAAAPVLEEIHKYRAELSGSIERAVGGERLQQLTASLFDLKTALLEVPQPSATSRAAS
jgi:MarR family transcriptional regulator, transcriptional regulator for hemolysin